MRWRSHSPARAVGWECQPGTHPSPADRLRWSSWKTTLSTAESPHSHSRRAWPQPGELLSTFSELLEPGTLQPLQPVFYGPKKMLMLLFSSICRTSLNPWSLWDPQMPLGTSGLIQPWPQQCLSVMLCFLCLNTSTPSILLLCWKTLVPGHPLGPVINVMSVWGTGTDCKGHLVLCVWHELARVPTAGSSSSPRGGDSRAGEQLNWWLLCGWDRKQCMKAVGGLPASPHGCEITLYFHCNQDLWEFYVDVPCGDAHIEHISMLPAQTYTHAYL